MDEDAAIVELKRRKLPLFIAKIIVAFILPFIAAERLGAVFNFEDIDYNGVHAEIGNSIKISIMISLPLMIVFGLLLWFVGGGFYSLLFSALIWPLSGLVILILQRKIANHT